MVSVFGTLSELGIDEFDASVRGFEDSTGIDVRYVGSSDFENDLLERLRRGDPPDLALLPQPGLLRAITEDGFALPWTGDLAAAADRSVDQRLVDLATFDGQQFGAWYQLTLKSLIWYSPREFTARGLSVPTTWDGLVQLVDEIVASGVAPWCLGIRDGGATGWAATDWVEDLLLRSAGPDAYDAWVAHDLAFTDHAVNDAATRFGAIALDRTKVFGGNRAAVEFTVGEAARQLLASPTKCLLHHQASFLPRMVGGNVNIALDGDLWAFPVPPMSGSAAPLVVGGNMVVRFSDDPNVNALAAYLTSDAAAKARIARGGFVSPRESIGLESYRDPMSRAIAGWVRNAEVVRFDASDLMPPDVGVGTFWSGMTAYLGGARLSSVLQTIDASWPLGVTTRPAPMPELGGSGG
ncbi:MAG: hypothetical protein RLZZ623_1077 [Actinomycetota bacterium]